jgi:RNA polymerase sigma-70 factor, ECF subfamily
MVTFLSMIENEVVQSKLEQAYYLYRKQLIALAYDILKDRHEAEDIVQNAFIRFSDYIDENIDIECHKTRGFIVIIVRGLAFNLYNQRKRRATVNIDELENVIAGKEDGMPEIRALRIDKSAWVASELGKIRQEYADILTLKYTYEYSNEEISRIYSITEVNVRKRLSRARNALRKVIGGGDYE